MLFCQFNRYPELPDCILKIISGNRPYSTAQNCKIRIVFGHDIHFDLAVSQRFVINVQFIIQLYIDLIIVNAYFHVLCIHSDQHLSVRCAVVCLILSVSLKNHMGTGSTAFHNLYTVSPGNLDSVADLSLIHI